MPSSQVHSEMPLNVDSLRIGISPCYHFNEVPLDKLEGSSRPLPSSLESTKAQTRGGQAAGASDPAILSENNSR
jgi:hypothetical protein